MPSSGFPEELCRRFSLVEINRATHNFHNDFIIGEGAFGQVYKGKIQDGSNQAMDVSIKRRSKDSYQGEVEFKTEVQLCCQLRHPNLVPLIGFCDDHDEMILVFEYMAKGSLDTHLFSKVKPLPWKLRIKICIDVARGIHYLHCGAKYAIIHRDIKVSNILLDKNWVAKVSGFGWSKRGPSSMSKALIRMDSRVVGTRGYCEPEYMTTGELSDKTDVYMFGVLLLEVISGRKPLDRTLGEPELLHWAQSCINNRRIDRIIDPCLVGKIDAECLKMFVDTAERCVYRQRSERPAMGEVEVRLESALELQDSEEIEGVMVKPVDADADAVAISSVHHNKHKRWCCINFMACIP